jgi:uroporphyrinogen III methyltransferase/synthase
MNEPLRDKNIVVTRDPAQSRNLIEKLTALGGKVYAFPTIKIKPPDDWQSCDQALEQIEEFDWIIFSSANGVRYFLKRAEHHGISYFHASIASVGVKTARELKKYGITSDLIPSSYTAQGLLNEFKKLDIKTRKILIPTSNLSRNELASGLSDMGADVEKIICYRTDLPDLGKSGDLRTFFADKKVDCYTFYSPSAFSSFLKLIGDEPFKKTLSKKTALAAIGPTTARAIKKQGFRVHIQPRESIDESMIEAIVTYFNKMKE